MKFQTFEQDLTNFGIFSPQSQSHQAVTRFQNEGVNSANVGHGIHRHIDRRTDRRANKADAAVRIGSVVSVDRKTDDRVL